MTATVLHLTRSSDTVDAKMMMTRPISKKSRLTLATTLRFLGKHSQCCQGLHYNVSKDRHNNLSYHSCTCSCSNSLACEFVNLRLAIQSNSIASRLPLLVSVKHVLEIINMKCARRDAVEKLIVFL